MELNEFGENENCAFYRAKGCAILVDWYNVIDENSHCCNCSFFKTPEQHEQDKIKYPYMRQGV